LLSAADVIPREGVESLSNPPDHLAGAGERDVIPREGVERSRNYLTTKVYILVIPREGVERSC